jgi:hypothetical protein
MTEGSHEEAADDAAGLSLSEAVTAFMASAQEAQRACVDRRELTVFEAHPERVGRLVDALVVGNYRDIAGTLAGITSRSLRSWMSKAEDGDPRYQPVAALVEIAEALAESSAVRKVRAAGTDPRFWAAEMTFLERRHPERWARRSEGHDTPNVVIQIGGPCQVRFYEPAPALPAVVLSADEGQG